MELKPIVLISLFGLQPFGIGLVFSSLRVGIKRASSFSSNFLKYAFDIEYSATNIGKIFVWCEFLQGGYVLSLLEFF